MARNSRKSQCTDIATRVIYILHAPFSTDFFIGHCRKDLLRDVYKDPLHGERYKTVSFPQGSKNRVCIHACISQKKYPVPRSMLTIMSSHGRVYLSSVDTHTWTRER